MRANECDAQALIWSRLLRCPNADTLYRDVRPGQRFRFKADGEVLTKVAGGWYRAADGRRYRTGARVGVERLP